MPHQRTRQFLIAYDVANPSRLQRVHRVLTGHAVPVQHSVFAISTTAGKLDDLMDELNHQIHHQEDDVRAYPIADDPDATTLGAPNAADSAVFTAAEYPLLDIGLLHDDGA